MNEQILTKIRALLAKAESTQFPEEARSYAAKAQELMTKWAIDEAMLRAAQGGNDDERDLASINQTDIWIDANEYRGPKLELLGHLVKVNDCHWVMYRQQYRMIDGQRKRQFKVGIIGFPDDRKMIEVMFTSLLTQAAQESLRPEVLDTMTSECAQGGHRIAWKNSFVTAFARSVGARLLAIKRATEQQASVQYGENPLAMVLVRKDSLVERKFKEMYPKLRKCKASSHANFVGSAFGLGREAGNRADLGQPKVGGNRHQISG